MAYWLMKCEPAVYSMSDLVADQTTCWEGVRNYQARNMLRDQMQVGDRAFFYHSNCAEPGIVGIMQITRAGYVDHTAFDPDAKYYDRKSDPTNPRWYMVDVQHERTLTRTITLRELKPYADNELQGLPLVRKGNRLSVMPLTSAQWQFVLNLE